MLNIDVGDSKVKLTLNKLSEESKKSKLRFKSDVQQSDN